MRVVCKTSNRSISHLILLTGRFNDLWRYRVNDNTWTWISGNDTVDQPGVYGEKGVPSSDNQPSARDSATGCYDNIAQEFWLFGGRATSNTICMLKLNYTTLLITNFCNSTSNRE